MSTSQNPFIRFLEKLGMYIPDEETGRKLLKQNVEFWTTLPDHDVVEDDELDGQEAELRGLKEAA